MPFIMGSWKILQRRTYDVLSHKYSFVFLLLGFMTLTVSVIQFGEIWIEWNQSDTMYNSFSDNVIGKSLQKKLCQILPIDVVYTWVNGSDPLLIDEIKSYQNQILRELVECPFKHCIPSHIISFREWTDSTHNKHNYKRIKIMNSNTGTVNSNWTLVEFASPAEAFNVIQNQLDIGNGNATLHQSYWTSDEKSSNSYLVPHAVIIHIEHQGTLKLVELNPTVLSAEILFEINKVWVDISKQVVVLELTSETHARNLLHSGNVTVFGHKNSVTQAYLILEVPPPWDIKDFAPSRFEDKEELRYSLRSLEMYAPWVRHIYLVTNGQIPYWLNLDHPRLTVLSHEDIFPNHLHLPTFSSPAIESHLHRIPGLSQQFLYLNDDVFFGKEVWPEDFVTYASGQKVYLSWPVPDCSDSCPWSWVGDGSCDISCNISDCSYDGGDCNPSNENYFVNDDIFYDEHHSNTLNFPLDEFHLLEDGFRDIGEQNSIERKHSILAETSTKSDIFRYFKTPQHRERSGHNVRIENGSLADLDLQIHSSAWQANKSKEFTQSVDHVTLKSNETNYYYLTQRKLNAYENKTSRTDVNTKDLFLNSNHGFNSKRSQSFPEKRKRFKKYQHPQKRNMKVKQNQNNKSPFIVLSKSGNSGSRAKNISTFSRKWRTVSHHNEHYKGRKSFSKRLRDTFAESLLYVNRLYNNEYGFEVRKVPAHMPHLIDKAVMESLQLRFHTEWERTSSNRIRSPYDMQFAFSYFYFLMSEKQNRTLSEIFDIFDTDMSGTWSDREIRTLLTQVNDLPLHYQKVLLFEDQICNCSSHFKTDIEISTPPYERYQDSKLPVVSKQLIDKCEPVKQMLLEKFSTSKKYQTEVVKDKNQAVTFKMLSSNLSQLILMLDEIRREPKKFICLNDNLDPSREKDNAIVRAVLQDFYESLFPVSSSFELPPEYRNRFLHMSELQAWRAGRNFLRNCIYLCLLILFTFTLLSFLQIEQCCLFQRRRITRKIYQDV